MKTIVQAKKDDQPEASGLYACIKPNPVSASRILGWFAMAGFEMLLPADLHTTLMYDTGHDFEEYKPKIVTERLFEIAPVAKVTGFDKFGDEKDCLVMTLESKDLDKINKELSGLGLKHSYPSFRAHITLSYHGEKIKISDLELPTFSVVFNPWIEINPINTEYKAGIDGIDGLRLYF